MSWYTEVKVTGVSSYVDANVAYPLTKSLLQSKFEKHRADNGIRSMSESS